MERSISIRLTGHEHAFLLEEEAYRRLDDYLIRARLRLHSNPDIEDVIADLERSIGERIADLEPTGEGKVTASDVETILTEVGAVDLGDGKEMPTPAGSRPRAGFCAGSGKGRTSRVSATGWPYTPIMTCPG